MRECVEARVCTGSDHPLDTNPARVDFFSEFVDGLCGVLVGVGVHVGLYSWERDCRKTTEKVKEKEVEHVRVCFHHLKDQSMLQQQ